MKLTYNINEYTPDIFEEPKKLELLANEISLFSEYPYYERIDIDLGFLLVFDPSAEYTEFDHLCYTFILGGIIEKLVRSIWSLLTKETLSKVHFINVDESLAQPILNGLSDWGYKHVSEVS